MRLARKSVRLLAPWAAMLAAALGWFGSQQAGSDSVIGDCRDAGWWWIVLISLFGLALTAAGGFLSLRIWRHEKESQGEQFVALVGMMTAGVLGFAILLQTLASLIIPRCFA
ncbi:MAG TPA: hypothetical protein VGW34_07165 [Allosphingosinicella sp.]|nr:hypothetical protein [Allosphingosinicella sp.]